jgi:hypothetical protein
MGIRTAKEVLIKTPYETVTRIFEFNSEEFDTNERITNISHIGITPTGEGHLTKIKEAIQERKVILVLEAGLLNTTYNIDVQVLTNKGQVLEALGQMRVEEA